MVKTNSKSSATQVHLEFDNAFAIRCTIFVASFFSFLCQAEIDLKNVIEQIATEDTYKTGAPELSSYMCKN